MARVDRLGAERRGARARAFLCSSADRSHAPLRRLSAVPAQHRLRQHHRRWRRSRDYPGDRALERRIEAYIRWNAMAMVVQANRKSTEYGGHISPATPPRRRSTRWASITSGARRRREHPGDLVFIQGHSSPGIYARAYLEGRLTEEQLQRFRQEVDGRWAQSSYPHPWLMPDFWQFPTVSMGLGPMMAIYQARFIRYLEHRGLVPRLGPQGLGVSAATARWTSPSRWARSRCRCARSSTT